jgi:hypothetical protein
MVEKNKLKKFKEIILREIFFCGCPSGSYMQGQKFAYENCLTIIKELESKKVV